MPATHTSDFRAAASNVTSNLLGKNNYYQDFHFNINIKNNSIHPVNWFINVIKYFNRI